MVNVVEAMLIAHLLPQALLTALNPQLVLRPHQRRLHHLKLLFWIPVTIRVSVRPMRGQDQLP